MEKLGRVCGHSLVVKLQPSKLAMRVRFPLPAPLFLTPLSTVFYGNFRASKNDKVTTKVTTVLPLSTLLNDVTEGRFSRAAFAGMGCSQNGKGVFRRCLGGGVDYFGAIPKRDFLTSLKRRLLFDFIASALAKPSTCLAVISG